MAHCLYRCFDATGQLLYVGRTLDPKRRFSQHGQRKSWWECVANITIESFPDAVKLKHAEKLAIEREQPRYNVHYITATPVAAAKPSNQTMKSLLDECEQRAWDRMMMVANEQVEGDTPDEVAANATWAQFLNAVSNLDHPANIGDHPPVAPALQQTSGMHNHRMNIHTPMHRTA